MSIQGMRKELSNLKKEYAPNFKTIEELQKSDIRTLTDEELFRLIQLECPEFKTLEELTDDILKNMCKGDGPGLTST